MLDRTKQVEELIEGTQVLRRKVFERSLAKKASITSSQWRVVGHVFRNEGCTTGEVAAALQMTGSAATQLINGLVAKGYVKRLRNLEDRRVHKLSLSKESRKRIIEFKSKRVRTMLKLFEALSDTEFKHYVALNKKIIQRLSHTTL
jgi:DNA-binding MarR family transcriptional regulator